MAGPVKCHHRIGKTDAKVLLVEGEALTEVARQTPSALLSDGAYPHHDVEPLSEFMLQSLAELHREQPIP